MERPRGTGNPAGQPRMPGWRDVGEWVERTMNDSPTTQPEIAPFLAIHATGTPPQPRKHALQPEADAREEAIAAPHRPWNRLTSPYNQKKPVCRRPTTECRPTRRIADGRQAPNAPAEHLMRPGTGRGASGTDGDGPVGAASNTADRSDPGRGAAGNGPRYSALTTRHGRAVVVPRLAASPGCTVIRSAP